MCTNKLYDKIIHNSKEAEKQYLSMATNLISSKECNKSPLTDEAFKEQLERVFRNNVLDTDIRITGDTVIGARQKEQKPEEWEPEYAEENLQTRFAFYTYKDEPKVLYLSNLFVEESSRNHGYGTRILEAAEEVADVFGANFIRLKVKKDSPVNEWYRKHGYKLNCTEGDYDWLEKDLTKEPIEKFIPVEKTLEYKVGFNDGVKSIKPAEWTFPYGVNETVDKLIAIAECLEMDGDCLFNGYTGTECGKFLRDLARKQVECKPVGWSEEDEKAVYFINQFLEYHEASDPSAKSCKEWINNRLKSLRPSWKPSEEELVALKNVGGILRDYGHGELAKMVFMIEGKLANLSVIDKSIWKPSEQEKSALRTAIYVLTEERNLPKTAAQLQNILDAFKGEESSKDWKPSEEQMKHLEMCFTHGHTVGLPNQHVLESLYQDLKKLM